MTHPLILQDAATAERLRTIIRDAIDGVFDCRFVIGTPARGFDRMRMLRVLEDLQMPPPAVVLVLLGEDAEDAPTALMERAA